MTISTRLQKVTEGLSPLQRAVLVLKAIHDGREVDPAVKDVKDSDQRRTFNRYMGLLWVANHQLGAISGITAYRVEIAENEKYRFTILNEAADLLDEAEGNPRSKGRRNWRDGKDNIEVAVFLRSLALECRDNGAALVEHLWQEVLSLEQVMRDLSADFAGEEIVIPEHRQRIEETVRALRDLAQAFGIKKLPSKPDEAMISAWVESVNESFRHPGLVEPF